jgi:Kae1-associated kinase Bud32
LEKELIQEGAEAKIYKVTKQDEKTNSTITTIIKERLFKNYRIKQINDLLIGKRTRRELKVIKRLQDLNIKVPNIIYCDKKTIIEMEFINGEKLRDVLDNEPILAKQIGTMLAKIHDADITHGDLTTSNIILEETHKLCLIDFGLSEFTKRLEDKAVDIHLFKQALESKHHHIFDEAYQYFLDGYNTSENSEHVLQRLKAVEARGRNKKH